MPTYQYECDVCRYSFDVLQSIKDEKLKVCPQCGKEALHRLIGTGGGIIFKGNGFYETDYKRKPDKAKEPKVKEQGAEESKKEPAGNQQTKVASKDSENS